MKLFPSGQVYHENKNLVGKIQRQEYRPYVFHMCWTTNREDKLVYFRDLKLWYLDDGKSECKAGTGMLDYVNSHKKSTSNVNLRDTCCRRELYWPAEK